MSRIFNMEPPPFPDDRFSVVYADPPWMFADSQGEDPARGGFKYPPMTVPFMRRLPVRDISLPQAALAIWVTPAHSAEGAHCFVAQGWGFQLVTLLFVWVKLNPKTSVDELLFLNASQGRGGHLKSGLGAWVNGNVELCYLGFNSSPRLPRRRKDVKQLIFAPVGEHSAKPSEAARRLETLFGEVPRIELFRRGKAPEGWTGWGNQAESIEKQEVLF